MFDFETMPYIYWSNITKANFLQRFIIVHSIIYYHLNESCISDKLFDEVAKQLVALQQEMSSEEFEKTTYYYCMYDFDGSTGFYLYDNLIPYDKQYLTKIAHSVLYNKRGK